jgi:hypothetical protein
MFIIKAKHFICFYLTFQFLSQALRLQSQALHPPSLKHFVFQSQALHPPVSSTSSSSLKQFVLQSQALRPPSLKHFVLPVSSTSSSQSQTIRPPSLKRFVLLVSSNSSSQSQALRSLALLPVVYNCTLSRILAHNGSLQNCSAFRSSSCFCYCFSSACLRRFLME